MVNPLYVSVPDMVNPLYVSVPDTVKSVLSVISVASAVITG